MLQPELKAIKDGLKYTENYNGETFGYKWTYKGYINEQCQLQGVGIKIYDDGSVNIGEWREDKLHGTCKREFPGGKSYWGTFKHGDHDGFGI